jgi:ATP-binding protein involved in chromosome partitioning
MTTDAERAVWAALERVRDPEILRPITELGMVQEIDVDEAGRAEVSILLTIAGCPAARRIEADVLAAARGAAGVSESAVNVGVMTPEQRRAFIERVRGDRGSRPQQFGPDSLTRVIAVTSGKGGVGKSSLTAGLAVAMAAQGLTVGLVDADVFGFSIPGILGLSRDGRTEQPTRVDDMILPPVAFGVKVISIGMFLAARPCRGADRCCTAPSSSSCATSGSATSTCCCSICRRARATSRSAWVSCCPRRRCSW